MHACLGDPQGAVASLHSQIRSCLLLLSLLLALLCFALPVLVLLFLLCYCPAFSERPKHPSDFCDTNSGVVGGALGSGSLAGSLPEELPEVLLACIRSVFFSLRKVNRWIGRHMAETRMTIFLTVSSP
jgi:hypothetical protein